MDSNRAFQPESTSGLFVSEAASSPDDRCFVCEQSLNVRPDPEPLLGLVLRTTQERKPVCQECGRRLAPVLSGLLDLARTAQRVSGVQGSAPLRVSMEALLELAHVSERYFSLVSIARATP